MNGVSFRFDITTKNKSGIKWKAIRIGRVVVLADCGMKIICLAPRNELANGFGHGCGGEFLLGQNLPGCVDMSLDTAQLRRRNVLMLLRTALYMHSIAAKLSGRLLWRDYDRIVNGSNLLV